MAEHPPILSTEMWVASLASSTGSGKESDVPFRDEEGWYLSTHPSPVVWGHSHMEEEGLVLLCDMGGRDREEMQSENCIF